MQAEIVVLPGETLSLAVVAFRLLDISLMDGNESKVYQTPHHPLAMLQRPVDGAALLGRRNSRWKVALPEGIVCEVAKHIGQLQEQSMTAAEVDTRDQQLAGTFAIAQVVCRGSKTAQG